MSNFRHSAFLVKVIDVCQSAELLTEPPDDFETSQFPVTLPLTLPPLDALSLPRAALSELALSDAPDEALKSTISDSPESCMLAPLDDEDSTSVALMPETVMLAPLDVLLSNRPVLSPLTESDAPLDDLASAPAA